MSDTSRRDYSYLSLVLEADPDHYVHDEEVYEFSGGRKFLIDDHCESTTKGGVYGIEPTNTIIWDGTNWGMDWDGTGDEVLWD